jgi:hypothetical protein
MTTSKPKRWPFRLATAVIFLGLLGATYWPVRFQRIANKRLNLIDRMAATSTGDEIVEALGSTQHIEMTKYHGTREGYYGPWIMGSGLFNFRVHSTYIFVERDAKNGSVTSIWNYTKTSRGTSHYRLYP